MASTYARVLSALDEDEKLLFFLATHIAPVLKGLRPATLVCFGAHTQYDRAWNRQRDALLDKLPLSCFPLHDPRGHRRFLFYHPVALEQTLNKRGVRRFLATRNYDANGSVPQLLNQLAKRFRDQCPHEVGLFLGYPLADVFHFIQGHRPCLVTAYWKVYTNLEEAQETFEALDRERDRIVEALQQGRSIHSIWHTLLVS